MGLQGNLRDMSVADLIQHTCQDGKTAQVIVRHAGQEAELYFENGQVVHASLNGQQGEEIVFETLIWDEGVFNLETGIAAPARTITRSWSGLLLEGARRVDEGRNVTDLLLPEYDDIHSEVNQMAQNLEEVLKEMGSEVAGYITGAVIGMDGISLAVYAKVKSSSDSVAAQVTLLFKLVDGTVEKLGAGVIEDNLTTTENAYILTRFLPGKQYFLGMVADRKSGQLGNMRLMSKLYVDRLAKVMPR